MEKFQRINLQGGFNKILLNSSESLYRRRRQYEKIGKIKLWLIKTRRRELQKFRSKENNRLKKLKIPLVWRITKTCNWWKQINFML